MIDDTEWAPGQADTRAPRMADERAPRMADEHPAGGFESYEIRFFAERNGMSLERARELIEQRGYSRPEHGRARQC